VITEIGGTTGDIEGLPFLEAIRQMRLDQGRDNVLYIHLTLVPYIKAAHEIKTKPTQHSVKGLREIGIQPDILLCRCDRSLSQEIKAKIALFCNVEERSVIEAIDAESIYHVPLKLWKAGLDDIVVEKLRLDAGPVDIEEWEKMVHKIFSMTESVDIAVVGKYIQIVDAYKSIMESFTHAGVANDVHVNLKWIDAEKIEEDGPEKWLESADGILVPGGFGERGTEGKITAVRYARENDVPYLGICLGLQMAVIEFARNVCGLEAGSSEFDPNNEIPHPVIDLMRDQVNKSKMGGTMRLGAYPCVLQKGTLAYELYGVDEISERHRHRWEVNNDYREQLAAKGLVFSGLSPDGSLVEIIELPGHPYFIAGQFHPELKSRPMRAHPLFRGLVAAAKKLSRARAQGGGTVTANLDG
jgi:CTP synthase